MYIVIVTTDGGNSEDGNIHYCDFVVYPDFTSAVDACADTFKRANPDSVEIIMSENTADFSDGDNWLAVRPCSAGISLQVEQE